MTHSNSTTLITLDKVRYQHPNGQVLFDSLSATIDNRLTGLVGDNGMGKSTLARLMAGVLKPSTGHLSISGKVHYVPQNIQPKTGETVVDLLQIRTPLTALERIEKGSTDPNDFEVLDERWSLRQTAQEALNQFGLQHVTLDTPLQNLSGGEMTQVALIGAFLSEADVLILDEPTNHLDRLQRQRLHQRIRDWSKVLIVISHDVELLNQMARILELTPKGLQSYGGNFAFYQQQKQHEQAVALDDLTHAKLERKKGLQTLQRQKERQQKRQQRATKSAKHINQSKALLDFQKNRSEVFTGKHQAEVKMAQKALNETVQQAEKAVVSEAEYHFFPPETVLDANKQVLRIEHLLFPFGLMPKQTLDLHLMGPQRVGLMGQNGCGKSTLLKLIAGQISSEKATAFDVYVPVAYIDQHARFLQEEQSVLTQVLDKTDLTETEVRLQLAQLALDADKIHLPTRELSGGERIKAALLLAVLQKPTPQLLLLDEPTNHIDYRSQQALIGMLNNYQGALMAASHDLDFLKALNLTHKLVWEPQNCIPILETF